MKKNIFSVIITALTFVNVVLTAILFFVMMPTFQKTNEIVTKVATVLNIELEQGGVDAESQYKISDVEYTDIAFDAQQTINLGKGQDGKAHYALFDGYTIGVNKLAEDYESFPTAQITAYQSTITDIVRSVMQSQGGDNVSEENIKKQSLEKIREKFGTKSIVEITLKNFMYQ